MAKADFHIHTKYSDGEENALEILENLKHKKVDYTSITDHNNINFYTKNQEYLEKETNITIFNGAEFTAYSKQGKVHVLGYDMDLNNTDLLYLLKDLQMNERKKVAKLFFLLKKMNKYNISFKEFEKQYHMSNCYSYVHIAEYLIKKNIFPNISSAYEKFNHYGIEDTFKISAEQIIEIIYRANGIPVLAHPITLKKKEDDLSNVLNQYRKHGLQGIEIYHSLQNEAYSEMLWTKAQEQSLITSCGSDYHGSFFSPNAKLAGINEFPYFDIHKVTILNELLERSK